MLAAFPLKAANMPIPERIFASNSFWYTPIPVDAPLHTNSANFTADFLRQKKAYYGTVTCELGQEKGFPHIVREALR